IPPVAVAEEERYVGPLPGCPLRGLGRPDLGRRGDRDEEEGQWGDDEGRERTPRPGHLVVLEGRGTGLVFLSSNRRGRRGASRRRGEARPAEARPAWVHETVRRRSAWSAA